MFSMGKSGARLAVAAIALFAMRAGAMAADLPATKDVVVAPIADPVWFVRVGAAGIFYNGSAKINALGVQIPGATVTIPNNATVLFEGGYYILPNVFLEATAGIPPTATLNGAGSASRDGTLGKATYAPAVLSVNYQYKGLGAFQPYIGAGVSYAIIFNSIDGAVSALNVHNNFGVALQGGVEYYLNRNWAVYADAKHIWLQVNANANVGPGAPVTARVTADPTIISGGIAYHW